VWPISDVLPVLPLIPRCARDKLPARSSYTGDEVVWGAKFRSMFNMRDEDGEMSIDIRKLHDFDEVPVA